MLNKKITRKEFLKKGYLGALILLLTPVLKVFKTQASVSHREARYYKNLAG